MAGSLSFNDLRQKRSVGLVAFHLGFVLFFLSGDGFFGARDALGGRELLGAGRHLVGQERVYLLLRGSSNFNFMS